MKKSFLNIMLLPAVACAMLFSSCEKDDESNPVYQENTTGFVLNTPANAANNVYDLIAPNATVNLTCSQPNYGGMPLVTNYFVQVSLENDFANAEKFIELASSYNTADMKVNARQMNDAMIELFQKANGDVPYPDGPRKLFVRLRAIIDKLNMGECFSNVIELPNVLATYKAPELTYSKTLYIVGSSIQAADKAWDKWKPLAPVFGMEGEFYTLAYFPDGATFKWGESEGDWRGFTRLTAINDNAGAGVKQAASDDNIEISNGGWYLLFFTSKLGSSEVAYTLDIEAAHAYLTGAVCGYTGDWPTADSAWELTPSADASGSWVSPAMAGDGEMRAYVSVPGRDWWRTEFTINKGKLFWRTMDIPNNWGQDVGAEYSVACSAGDKLYVNFDTNTGEVK